MSIHTAMKEKKHYLVPMGKLLNLIEAGGFKLEYHYDDLVFINNTSLLFRFDTEKADTVYLHFNVDCAPEVQDRLAVFFMQQSAAEGLNLSLAGPFQFDQVEGKEEINIQFK
jgi:hypothetical protein